MIKRRRLPNGKMEVTFHVPADAGADRAVVVAEFNDWSPGTTPMVRTDDGFEATVVLPTGRSYRFRYVLDGDRWMNDWQADRYADNDFGDSDSVLDLDTGTDA